MTHLMKLELKKIHFLRYIFISIAAIILSMFFVFVALNDTSDNTYTFETSFRAVQLIFAFVYVIFFAVLVSSMIISEYNNKTILLMFTYPIDRKKLIISKLFIITLFMVTSILLGYLCCSLFIIGVDCKFNLVADNFTVNVLRNWIYAALSSTLVFCCLGFWSFVVGMVKKSITATIVSSIIFIYLRQIVIAASENYQENIWVILTTLVISLIALRYTFTKKIMQID